MRNNSEYVILIICLLITGIRFVFFSSHELNATPFYDNEKRNCIKKRYRIYGFLSLIIALFSIIFLFIPISV